MYNNTNNNINMSNSTHSLSTMSVEEWKELMNGVPDVSFDKVDVTTPPYEGGVTSISFVNTTEEKKRETDQQISLEALARSDQPFKWIVMGKTEYNEMGNWSLRPFGSLLEAIAYGEEEVIKKNSRGYSYYRSFVIQPLLKDINSFELTSEQIHMIREIEASVI